MNTPDEAVCPNCGEHFVPSDEAAKYVVDGRDTRALVLIEGRYEHPTLFRMTHSMIAYKVGDEVLCHGCALSRDLSEASAIYPVNVVPYSQDCHGCGTRIVRGWDCQLFDKHGGYP